MILVIIQVIILIKNKINSDYLIKSNDMLKDYSKNSNKENNYVGNNKSTNIINHYKNNFNNFNINYLSKNDKLYVNKDDYIFDNINNLIKPNENTNIDFWIYNNTRVGNFDNSLSNEYILNTNTNIKNKRTIEEINMKVNTRSIYFPNEIYNNDNDNKMKLDKAKKIEVIYNNNNIGTDLSHFIPVITNTDTIVYESIENQQNLNTSPIINIIEIILISEHMRNLLSNITYLTKYIFAGII